MEMSGIVYEKKDHIALVTINRTDAHNSMDPATEKEMAEVWLDFREDDNLWVAVLTGAGEKAFCTGGDMKAYLPARMAGEAKANCYPRAENFGGLPRTDVFKPIIAAVNGYAIAGGLELVLCCDIRIASETAKFGVAEVKWGIMPGAGGTIRLPRNIPYAVAMEMLLTGEPIDAPQALQFGLVNRVVPLKSVMDESMRMAEKLCRRGPVAMRAIKESVLRGLALEQGLHFEAFLFDSLQTSQDSHEGVRAFAERRKPVFKGK
jgi:enoyl-CoA hydratase/carnithine racemase